MFSEWGAMDRPDRLFIIWAFTLQILLIAHFALRKPFFETYTKNAGWIVYALCIPAALISVQLLRAGKPWSFWLGGFLFVLFAAYGFWVDYIGQVPFRSPFNPRVGVPYIILYLSTLMFYWWPLGLLSRTLWFAYAILFGIGTFLNITSH